MSEGGKDQRRFEYKFSPELDPLIGVLSDYQKNLPESTPEFLDKYGADRAIQLVSELIKNKSGTNTFFARACTLVCYKELPAETKEWFKKQGLLALAGENVIVHLRHRELRTPCHEIGQFITYGACLGQYIDKNTTPQVAPSSFSPHDASEQFPRGAWAEVRSWGRGNYTISAAFIAGTGPESRGILVPSKEQPIPYISTEHSFDPGKRRNFYLCGADPMAWWGFKYLGRYLIAGEKEVLLD